MACQLYDKALTLHSFAGLINSRMDVEALVNSVLSRESCLARWRNTEVLVIDEVSQLSKKTFETINFISQRVRGEDKPFGGLQVIAVGDFRQLPPVSNDLDKGAYCFESPLWRTMFTHNVLLTVVYRQEQREFIDFLGEISRGENLSERTVCFMNELASKNLHPKDFGLDFLPHIFCTNFDAKFHNMAQLTRLPGEIKVYAAIDTADEARLNKVTLAQSRLCLKVGAEVMLLYNLSSKLRNGTRGLVVLLEDDGPTVNFKEVCVTIKLPQCTWFAYKSGSKDVIVGQRVQYPLILAWGITAHKAQGQTMKAAVIHSGNEFVPGQLYVACSRVSTKEGLQMVGFNTKRLIKEDSRVTCFYEKLDSCPTLGDLTCCRAFDIMIDTYADIQIEGEFLFDAISDAELTEIENLCNGLFVVDSTSEEPIDLNAVLETITSGNTSQTLPDNLDVVDFLEELKDGSALCSEEGSLKAKMNNVIVQLQTEFLPNVHLLLQIYWARIANKFSTRVKKVNEKEKFDFKGILSDEMLMLNSPEISLEFSAVVKETQLLTHHFCIVTEIVKKLRSMYICKLYADAVFHRNVPQREIDKNVWEMDSNCHGKVRYVGGWVIAKLMQANRKYINTNMLSSNSAVRNEMHHRYKSIHLLESLLVHSSTIHSTTDFVSSLEVTDQKQYRDNALVYVNDQAFKFFYEP